MTTLGPENHTPRLPCLGIRTPGCAPARADSLPDASTNEVIALRHAITDLTATFGSRYPERQFFLARLDQMAQSAQLPREDFEKLRREALIANPLVSGQPLLYVVRSQYRPDHHNTADDVPDGRMQYQQLPARRPAQDH